MSNEQAALFSANWNIYQKIIAHNYMLHRHYGEQTAMALTYINAAIPLKVLDLGCGDAYQIAKQLKLQQVASYTGYDLSKAALAIAERNLQPIGCAVHLQQGFLQDFYEKEEGRFNIIYSSYALHHLQDGEKKILLSHCFNKLEDNGVVIIIDIIRSKTQSREEYIETYIDGIVQNWHALTQPEKELIYAHMRQYDFPASGDNITAWATEAGFTVKPGPVYDELHKMFILTKV